MQQFGARLTRPLLLTARCLLSILALAACSTPPEAGETSAETSLLGQQLYQAHCAACHGLEGEGEPRWKSLREDGTYPAPPHDSSGHTWHHADEVLLDIIRRGGQEAYGREGFQSRMPAWGDTLSDEEIRAVLEHIKTLWGPHERQYQAALD